jgi:pimeloyl-ACP methyl ester carboxylesterase
MTLGRYGKVGSGEMTFSRRAADAVELVEFLRNYLHKDKVILLAKSMGTLTGMPLVKQRQELFHALVVTDLYVDVARNEALNYQMTLERLLAADNSKAAAGPRADRRRPDPVGFTRLEHEHGVAFKTNLSTPNLDRKLLFPLALSSPICTLRDLFNVFMGFQWSTTQMYDELISTTVTA